RLVAVQLFIPPVRSSTMRFFGRRTSTRRPRPAQRTRLTLLSLEDRSLPSALSGLVFDDANNNGTQDGTEVGLAGVTVTLTGKATANHNVTQTQTTAADGSYNFAGLADGTYSVVASDPTGYLGGQAVAGSAGGSAGLGSVAGVTISGADASG